MAETGEQRCPACHVPVRPNPRYPRYICQCCQPFARAPDGRLVTFANADTSDGVSASYSDNGEEYPGRTCFIGDLACRTREAHLGGIVIEAVD